MSAIELKHVLAGDTLRYAGSGVPSGLYKIRIPAGTQAWRVGVQTYKAPEPAIACLSMDVPPIAAHSVPIGPDTRTTLQRLWAGESLLCESPANSGTLSISQPEMGGPWRADRERWLYLDCVFPGGMTLGIQSQVVLGKAPPAPQPTPEELHALDLVNRSGFAMTLYKFGNCQSDTELVQRSNDAGMTASIMALIRLAEQGAK